MTSYWPSRAARSHFATGLGVLGNTPLGEAFVASASAFVDRQQSFSVGNHLVCSVCESLDIHLVSLHFQLRISGMSWP